MQALADIIADIRNDADRDCVYNHEDLRCLADKLEHSGEVKNRIWLGQKVYICHDHNWAVVVTAVEERLGAEVHFKVEWRDGRDFRERWFTKKELDAFGQLEEP